MEEIHTIDMKKSHHHYHHYHHHHHHQSLSEEEDSRRHPGEAVKAGEWINAAVLALLHRYSEKFASGRGYLRVTDWQEVVDAVNFQIRDPRSHKTLKQCRDKVDSLKRRYKLEKKKAAELGESAVSWPYFCHLDAMMGSPPPLLPPPAKLARIPGRVDAGVKLGFSNQIMLDQAEEKPFEEDDEHLANDYSYHKFTQKGKSQNENFPSSSSDSDSESDGYSTPSCSEKNTSSTRDDAPDSLYKNNRGSARPPLGISGKAILKKCRSKPAHPAHALEDSAEDFEHFLARIEMAKAEILNRMKLEIAKLEWCRKRRSSSLILSESD